MDRDSPQRAGHGGVGDLDNAVGHFDDVHAQPVGAPFFDGRASGFHVEFQFSAEKILGINTTQDQVGVGDRGLPPALAVSGRPRVGSGALRTDSQHAAAVDPRD